LGGPRRRRIEWIGNGRSLTYNPNVDQDIGLRQRAKRLWFIYIASLDRTLTVLFVLCGLVIIAHDGFFAGWPELFSGGAMLWDWLYRLSFAFAASYIFYVVVVHVKRQRDKENVRDFLGKKTDRICEDARKLIGGLRGGNVMRYERHYYPSHEEVKSLCEHINLDDPAPLISKGKHVSWRQFMTLLMDSSRREITNIYAVSHLLDTDYLALLMAVEECPHFDFLQMGGYLHLPNLSFFAADQIYYYIEKVKALEQYSERTFSDVSA
jgi:hypothetical protein